ncbi:hypothetical protein JHL17_34130 [Azospirillum sp. YIM B02556]|uniref:Histidine kinase n=1 Tax=Azospirillum endophyticum TaxID=2800326 RepID=A0ABS1FG82_9PROT|nr:hypothetical protein [Azospirillum endophyticum]MBK1842446.1 hypothetical protein [Azospirillum endophyticum]
MDEREAAPVDKNSIDQTERNRIASLHIVRAVNRTHQAISIIADYLADKSDMDHKHQREYIQLLRNSTKSLEEAVNLLDIR